VDYDDEQNDKEKMWRKHKSYVWKGEIDIDGVYVGYNKANDDSFNWGIGANQTNSKWKAVAETTLYDHFSAPLEAKDINGNYASTKMGDNNSKVIAVSNARYTEMFYSGAEHVYTNNTNYFDGEIKSVGRTTEKAHTGTHSVKVTAGNKGFETKLDKSHRAGKYKVSVWIEKTNEANARVHVNGTSKVFNGESVRAGDWILKNHYEDLSSGSETVYITSSSGTIYADDFRLHPISSSMTTYVYNKWDELWCIIGTNGLATKYEYDSAGRLKATYSEVTDYNGAGSGGFKKTSENKYNYKQQ